MTLNVLFQPFTVTFPGIGLQGPPGPQGPAGPAGSGSRVIASVSENIVMGSAAGTDYVYFADGTITLSLPTAVGNTNRYTVKNVGTGVVSVTAVGSQIIVDVQAAMVEIDAQYNSLDFASDDSNWNII